MARQSVKIPSREKLGRKAFKGDTRCQISHHRCSININGMGSASCVPILRGWLAQLLDRHLNSR